MNKLFLLLTILPLTRGMVRNYEEWWRGQIEDDDTPDSFDWRDFGFDFPVYDERNYYKGYSWAFITVDTVASAYLIRTNQTVSPSGQELIDCLTPYSQSSGVNNIDLNTILMYILENGMATEEDYEYTGEKKQCQSVEPKLNIDYTIDISGDEDYLKRTVGCRDCGGPVMAVVDATNLVHYESGIVDNSFCNDTQIVNLNQAVLVVGYDTINGTDYWILKNTWGPDWGEDGYFRLSRNTNFTCGIGVNAKFVGKFSSG